MNINKPHDSTRQTIISHASHVTICTYTIDINAHILIDN